MKRLLAGLIGIVLVTGMVRAQAPFADVPQDHWAYDSVNTLAQRGLIIGYPDGMYGGKRAMTRYEFAVVIARMIPLLEESIRTQIAQIPTPAKPPVTGTTPPVDLTSYVTKGDLLAVQKLVDEFRPELAMLRVEVDTLKKDLAGLTNRVVALEKEVDRVKITGELTGIARMSALDRDTLHEGITPTDYDGRPLNRTNNLLEATQILYDMNLNIRGKVTDQITANAVVSMGNYYGGFATTALTAPQFTDDYSYPYGNQGIGSYAAEVTPYKAYLAAPVNLGIAKANIEVGKTGVQFTPYTLKLVDHDTYTHLANTDNGDVVFTGIKGTFNLGPVNFLAYGGTHGTALTGYGRAGSGYPVVFGTGRFTPTAPYSYDLNGYELPTVPEVLYDALPYLVVPATQSTGVHASMKLPLRSQLGLTMVAAGINNANLDEYPGCSIPGVRKVDVSRAAVYGANLSMNPFSNLVVSAEYATTDMFERGKTNMFNDDDSIFSRSLKDAIDAKAQFSIKGIELGAGYKKVNPYFAAPGSWGAIGRWKNPTNIQGYNGTVAVKLGSRLTLNGGYDKYESIVAGTRGLLPAGTNGSGYYSDPLRDDKSTKIEKWNAGVTLGLFNASSLNLGVETVNTTPGLDLNPGKHEAEETIYNVGFGTKMSDNASFKLIYQIMDYKDNKADFLYGGEDAKGSVAVGQFTVKF